MSYRFSRRDFLKVGGLSLAGLAFGQFTPTFSPGPTYLTNFDDSDLIRVAGSAKNDQCQHRAVLQKRHL